MSTIKFRAFVFFLAGWMFWSCTQINDRSKGEPKLKISGVKDSLTYLGGELKLLAVFEEGVELSDIQWRAGASDPIYHGYLFDEQGRVLEDTLWVEWTRLPPFSLDSVEVDSAVFRIDTVYFDTLGVSNALGESNVFKIKIENMNPVADSLYIQGREEPVEFKALQLTAHRGEPLRFNIMVSDPFNAGFAPRIDWVNAPGIRLVHQIDSLFTFEWMSPTELMRDTVEMRVTDSRGAGFRRYEVTRFTYNEGGSIWVSAGERLFKVSPAGDLIFKLNQGFKEISSIAVHPNRPFVFVADRGANQLYTFDYDGALQSVDSSNFRQPEALAIDVQSDRLWISDRNTSGQGRLRRFDVSSVDTLGVEAETGPYQGPVSSIGMDQFEADLVWFTIPEADQVGKIRDGVEDTLYSAGYSFNRPFSISYDAAGAFVWVADSSSVYQLDTTGVVQQTIKGFGRITNVATGPQGACVVDGRKATAHYLPADLSGITQYSQTNPIGNFVLPYGVAYLQGENTCWISDRELGTLFKIDDSGAILVTVPGFDQPGVLAVHQGVE